MKIIVLGILIYLFISLNGYAQKDDSPNVIIILADDLGYGDVGFNGCKDIPTPHIDKIAEQGVVFTSGYVSYCVCGPSRAGLLTGRYQDRFGFSRNPLFAPNDPEMGLPLSEETLADALKKVDYKTVAIGKWHLGAHEIFHPLKRGFDDFFGFLSGGHRYFPEQWVLNDPYEAKSQYDGYKTKLLRNFERIEETEYLTDALSREAVAYIEKYRNDPFFIYLAYNAPHTPLQATDKYLSRFEHIRDKKRRTYAAMVSAMDDGVGRVLDKLDALNLRKNTLVVFLSDNGGPENVNASNNDMLRGGKGDFFEGGIRVPFAMSWPQRIPSGMVYSKPVISLDIFATAIAQSADLVSSKNPLDGVNLIPYLTAEQQGDPHEFLFWRKFDAQDYAVRKGNDKMIVRKGDQSMLFDLKQDVSEQNNQINQRSNYFDFLYNEWKKWNSGLTDPVFMGLMEDEDYNALHPDRFTRPSEQEEK